MNMTAARDRQKESIATQQRRSCAAHLLMLLFALGASALPLKDES